MFLRDGGVVGNVAWWVGAAFGASVWRVLGLDILFDHFEGCAAAGSEAVRAADARLQWSVARRRTTK